MPRHGPLHTCGASFLAIIHTTCRKSQEINGPLGKLAKKITKSINFTLPILYSFQHNWLLILSFTDDFILTFENFIEIIFPPSTLLFNMIDNLVYKVEIVPVKFDEALNKFSLILDRIPVVLDWLFMQIIWWLELFISILLNHLGWNNSSDGDSIEEKDIMIDMNSSNNLVESGDIAKCPSQEMIFEEGKAERNVDEWDVEKAKNEEKLVLEVMKMENPKYSIQVSSRPNESGILIPDSVEFPAIAAFPGNRRQQKSKSADDHHVELPSISGSGREGIFENRRKSLDHVEFPSIAVVPGRDPSKEKRKSLDQTTEIIELETSGKKEEILKDDYSCEGKTELIGGKFEQENVEGIEKKYTVETIQEMDKKDPIIDLFESGWLLK